MILFAVLVAVGVAGQPTEISRSSSAHDPVDHTHFVNISASAGNLTAQNSSNVGNATAIRPILIAEVNNANNLTTLLREQQDRLEVLVRRIRDENRKIQKLKKVTQGPLRSLEHSQAAVQLPSDQLEGLQQITSLAQPVPVIPHQIADSQVPQSVLGTASRTNQVEIASVSVALQPSSHVAVAPQPQLPQVPLQFVPIVAIPQTLATPSTISNTEPQVLNQAEADGSSPSTDSSSKSSDSSKSSSSSDAKSSASSDSSGSSNDSSKGSTDSFGSSSSSSESSNGNGAGEQSNTATDSSQTLSDSFSSSSNGESGNSSAGPNSILVALSSSFVSNFV